MPRTPPTLDQNGSPWGTIDVVIDRIYSGERNAATDDPADRGALVVYVREEGGIHPLHQVVFHSPSGLEWGCTGSGPADLALSLLADALDLNDEHALEGELQHAHQTFKRQIVSQLPHHGWSLTREQILDWLQCWRNRDELPPEACDVCGNPNAALRGDGQVWCDECWNLFDNKSLLNEP